MTAHSDPIDPEIRPFVEETGSLLEEAFGVPFDFWLPGEPWLRLTRLTRYSSHDLAPDFVPSAELSRALRVSEPMLDRRTEGRWWIGLPIDRPSGGMLLASTLVGGTPTELLSRLGRLSLRQLDLRRRLERCRHGLERPQNIPDGDARELKLLRQALDVLGTVDITCGTWHLARAVLPLLRPLVQAETVALVPDPGTTSPDGREAVTAVSVGGVEPVDAEVCQALVERFSDGPPGEPGINNHVSNERDASLFPGVRQVMLVPVIRAGVPCYWLVAVNRLAADPGSQSPPHPHGSQEFSASDTGMATVVASLLAAHERNAGLYHQRESLLVGLVRSMVSAIDAKDPYTRGHSERVAMIARTLAEELGLDAVACQRVFLTGLLHDLGKIGVRDAILHKPGKLTDEERAEIMRHPDQGWAILRDLNQLHYELPGVLHHHENYDGTGYPDRLAGQEIPLPARIVAVADAFDAMSSDRPYRRGMPWEQVLDVLRGGSATQWDPDVIEAFFHGLPAIRNLAERLRSTDPGLPARSVASPPRPDRDLSVRCAEPH